MVCFFRVRVGAEASIDFELELEIPVYSGFFVLYFTHMVCFYSEGEIDKSKQCHRS